MIKATEIGQAWKRALAIGSVMALLTAVYGLYVGANLWPLTAFLIGVCGCALGFAVLLLRLVLKSRFTK